MSRGLYLLSSEPRSGKTLTAVGLMEAVSTRLHPLALFRPVVADIGANAAATAAAFGIEPRVAMLSYSTGESGKGPEVEKVREATRLARNRFPDLKIEGPIQYDAAIDAEVARVKMPESEVAGGATVPDIVNTIAITAIQAQKRV